MRTLPSLPGSVRVARRAVARAAALLLFAAAAPADEPPVPDVISGLASALSQGDSAAALAAFDPAMKDFGAVSANIDALLAQSEVLCAIDIVSQTGDPASPELDADWYLQIKGRSTNAVERRRQRVRLRLSRIRGKWRIAALSPLSVLEPAPAR